MSNWALRTDRTNGAVAFYQTNGASGDPTDPASTLNAPLRNWLAYLDLVKFHTELDQLEVAFSGSGSITHGSIAGAGATIGMSSAFGYDAGTDDTVLLAHSMGYVPFALVAVGSNILWPGMPVQSTGDGGARYATAYVDGTNLSIYTTATIGLSTLPSVTLTYEYLVFKAPPPKSGHTLIGFDHATGVTEMGLGKFSADRPYLQVVAGGSPLGLSMGRTIDLDNGAPRAWRPDGTTYDVVPTAPAALKQYLPYYGFGGASISPGSETPGASMQYSGSYAGPSSVEVQAP